jgi:hypothetical protein
MAKSENLINNFIVLRNDRESIEQNLISATDAEQKANYRRMSEEASHADAGTGFLIKMKDFKDKFPEEILLAAIRSAEKSLHDKSVSNASGNRATKTQRKLLRAIGVHNANPDVRGEILALLSVKSWTFRGASKEGAFA